MLDKIRFQIISYNAAFVGESGITGSKGFVNTMPFRQIQKSGCFPAGFNTDYKKAVEAGTDSKRLGVIPGGGRPYNAVLIGAGTCPMRVEQ